MWSVTAKVSHKETYDVSAWGIWLAATFCRKAVEHVSLPPFHKIWFSAHCLTAYFELFLFLRVPPSSTVHSCRPPLPAPTPPHSQPLPSCTPVPPPIPGLPSQHTSRRESAQRQAPVTGHYKGDVPFSLSLFMVQSKSSSATSYFMPGAKGLAAVDEMMKPTCNNYISSLLPGKRSSNIPRNE